MSQNFTKQCKALATLIRKADLIVMHYGDKKGAIDHTLQEIIADALDKYAEEAYSD